MYTQWQKYCHPPKKGNSDIAHSNHFLSLPNLWNTIYSIFSIILYKKNDENWYRNECMNYFLSVWGGWQYLYKPLYLHICWHNAFENFFCGKWHCHFIRSSFSHNSIICIVIRKVNIYLDSAKHSAGARVWMKKIGWVLTLLVVLSPKMRFVTVGGKSR